MTFLIYLLICLVVTLGFIYYGIRWQRQRQQTIFQEEMDYEDSSKQ